MAHDTPSAQRVYLSQEEVEAIFGIRPRTLECWRHKGSGPAFVRAGRLVKYNREKFEHWMQQREIVTAG